MRKFIMITGILILVVLIGAAAVAMYVKIALPDVGPPENVVIERTPERVARGKYIANSVSICMDCHSQRDWTVYAGPLKNETFASNAFQLRRVSRKTPMFEERMVKTRLGRSFFKVRRLRAV